MRSRTDFDDKRNSGAGQKRLAAVRPDDGRNRCRLIRYRVSLSAGRVLAALAMAHFCGLGKLGLDCTVNFTACVSGMDAFWHVAQQDHVTNHSDALVYCRYTSRLIAIAPVSKGPDAPQF